MKLLSEVKKHWFAIALIAVALLTLADGSNTIARAGQWLGALGGVKICIFTMFLLSGLSLDSSYVRKGISDLYAIAIALFLIFIVAPFLAWLHALLPLDQGLRIGLFLIAIMPTTLSSGVVMTGMAGGNAATATMVTIIASWVGIFTIPLSLELFVGAGGELSADVFNKTQLALRLGVLVLLPLFLGMAIRKLPLTSGMSKGRSGQISQFLVLTVIWIAVSRSSETLQQAPLIAAGSVALAFSFHSMLFLLAVVVARFARLGPRRREAVWFMGAQKTMPIALLLQTTLFPQYGNALIYCVVHHIVHLAMDSYLAGEFRERLKNVVRSAP